jgi:hypothetical protein
MLRPRLATPRDPAYPTDGVLGAFVAHLHGRPWKPYHRQVADVIGEHTPDGRYRYTIVVITWPRQCGKTTFAFDLALGRGLQQTDYRCAYCAQTGHKTTERFGERFEELEGSPLATHVRPRRSQGTERIRLPGRSYLKAFPPKPGSLRSDALDLVLVDETQEHDELLGLALDQTIIPTFTTRPRRQLILIGTAGTDSSAYLRRYLEQARAGEPGYAVFEFGAEDADDFVHDEQLWPIRHPGLATGLTDVDALRQARATLGPAGFLREYGNVWTRTSDRALDPADWAAVQADPNQVPRPSGLVCFALDVEADRSSAAIDVASPAGYLEVVEHSPGLDWAAARLLELQARYAAPIAVYRYGAAGVVVDELERAGAQLLIMNAGEVANAAAGFSDRVTTRTLQVIPNPALTAAVDGAVRRALGDTGGFHWSRRGSAAPVAPLVAGSNALWGALHLPPPDIKPAVYAM